MALDPITLARRLREARENRRLTQEQAAQKIGISRTALVHIEAGKRSLSTLELSELAKLYHHSIADFFAEDEVRASREERTRSSSSTVLPTELINDPEVNRQVSAVRRTLAPSVWTLRPRWACSTPSACRSMNCEPLPGPTRRPARASGLQKKNVAGLDSATGPSPTWQTSSLPRVSGHLAFEVFRAKCPASSSAIRRYGWLSS